MEGIIEVHNSDIRAFKRCRRKWELSSSLRMNLRPKKINDKLWLGTGIHKAFEYYYGKGYDMVKVFKEWSSQEIERIKEENNDMFFEQEEMLYEMKELGIGMLKHYRPYAESVDDKYFEEIVETEHEFSIPIPTPNGHPSMGRYCGKIDGIVKDELGYYWLLEHKTAKRITTDHLPLDEQIVRYLWAAQELYGIELEGVLYNIIRKKIPREPKELKSGGLSKSKSILTTYSKYRNCLINYYGSEEAVPWDDYEKVLESLKDGYEDFYFRKRIRKSQKEIEDIKHRTYQEYREIRNPNKRIYPTPTKDCSWDCNFRHVCIEMNNGTDVSFMLEEMFEERKNREFEYDFTNLGGE